MRLGCLEVWHTMKSVDPKWRMISFAILLFTLNPAGAQNLPSGDGDIDNRVAAIIADWESLPSIFDDIDIYAQQMREIVNIGGPAAPALSAALDKTTKDPALRLLPFALRAIGDPRAVPALIRAIPKTLRPPGSDTGMTVTNAALGRFMQANSIDAAEGRADGRRGAGFGMGRPVREVATALRKITGAQLNEGEVFSTFLAGGDQQRALQRKAFDEVARNWANWWKENWKQFLDGPAYAEVGLPAAREEISVARFLTGANIKATGRGEMILSPTANGTNCVLNLALNRTLDLPETLRRSAATNSLDAITAWAAHAGVDVVGTQYRDPDSGKLYYCLRGVGLQAWEIAYDQYDQIETNLQNGVFPQLDAPASDLLVHYDAREGRYRPEKKAAFLFITRDGL